jgi:hypothetical protein
MFRGGGFVIGTLLSLLAIWLSSFDRVISNETFVGYGRHTLIGNNITKIGQGNVEDKWVIVQRNGDLEDYIKNENACDLIIDKNNNM